MLLALLQVDFFVYLLVQPNKRGHKVLFNSVLFLFLFSYYFFYRFPTQVLRRGETIFRFSPIVHNFQRKSSENLFYFFLLFLRRHIIFRLVVIVGGGGGQDFFRVNRILLSRVELLLLFFLCFLYVIIESEVFFAHRFRVCLSENK